MKPKKYNQKGFTLIELLVVIAIMALLMTVLILDFNSQRANRNIVLAKNETATNIRKVQNYMISSRDISPGVPAKFYIIQFRTGTRDYTVQAVDNKYVFHDSLETLQLPIDIQISSLQVNQTSYSCLNVIYAAPFGTVYTYGSKSCSGIRSLRDGARGTTALVDLLKDPVKLAAIPHGTASITFTGSNVSGTVEINASTGQVTAR